MKNTIIKVICVVGGAFILLAAIPFAGRAFTILGLFWAIAAGFIVLTVRFKPKLAYICLGIFILSFVFQSVYSSYVTIIGEGDLQFYFGNAVVIYETSFSHENLYSATFPGTVTYPAILAVFFQIFGVHRIIPVLLNQFIMSGTIVMVFLYMGHRHNHLSGILCAMILATHPFVIIYSNTTNAELLYGACILLCLITFYFAHDRYKSTARKSLFLLPAFFLGLSQLFRPLGIIMLIALIMYALLFAKIKLRDNLIICPMLLAVFILFNFLCGAIVKGITSYDSPSSSYGWNLYVGASKGGGWNQADGNEFNRVFGELETPAEIQIYFAGKAFERYREMGFGVIRHGLEKLRNLHSAEYMVAEAFLLDEESAQRHTLRRIEYQLPIYLYYTPILFLALCFCLWSCVRSFSRKADEMMILTLYTIGSLMAFMLIEVAPRYAVSYHIMFTILAFKMALYIISYIRARKVDVRGSSEYMDYSVVAPLYNEEEVI
jgi:4-amino-4-deoxy-L-arabinose transferase-like glycosyltransferase